MCDWYITAHILCVTGILRHMLCMWLQKPLNAWCASQREQIYRNCDYYYNLNYPIYSELEHKLEEANLEISSLQYIN